MTYSSFGANALLFLILFSILLSHTQSEISNGTTILSLRFKNGVIVAADTRTSVSHYVSNRHASKISIVLSPLDTPRQERQQQRQRSTVCLCSSGSAADGQHLIQFVTDELTFKLHRHRRLSFGVDAVARLTRTAMRSSGAACSLICAGYDHVTGRGRVYSVSRGGTLMEETEGGFAVAGSGSNYAWGFLERGFEEDMEEDKAVNLIQRALELAIGRDGSSGGDIKIYVLDEEGEREVGTKGVIGGKEWVMKECKYSQ